MGEKKLGAAPPDLPIYELAERLHKTPDEIRGIDIEDRLWMEDVPVARKAAFDELARRGKSGEN